MATFKVYSKENCSNCTRAILLLTQSGENFEVLKLNEDFDREELFETFPGAKTFPQILLIDSYDEKIIGGADQLQQFLANR